MDIVTEQYARVSNIVQRNLLQQRKVFLWGMVEDESARTIVEQLHYLSAQDAASPIHFYINSPGGVVTAGNAIYDTMNSIAAPVYTYCMGFAASMGSVLLSAGDKGNRYIYPTAEVMIHQPSMGGFQARAKDIEIHAQQIVKAREISATILATNCGKDIQTILQDFDRDYWMNAEEAIAYGIVDKMAG
ncbi:ATP-dependent Clp protease proteolytic subunit [Chitinophagaceae bacterium IBVUCB1]|nr:ATP-dependent Clp protease proteolytic subunit [Chitinophagaceae bacterium IBVUCB1]